MGLRNRISTLINKIGRVPYKLTRKVQNDYTPGTGGDYSSEVSTSQGLCVCSTISLYKKGDYLSEASVEILFGVNDPMTPEIGDIVQIKGVVYTLIEVEKEFFKGQIVLYVCYGKRG